MRHDDFAIWLVLWWVQTICVLLLLRSGVNDAGMLSLSFGMLCAVADLYAMEKLSAFAPEHRFELSCFFGIFTVGLLLVAARMVFH